MARCDECLWREGNQCRNATNPKFGLPTQDDYWCSLHPQSVQYEIAVWHSTGIPVGWEPFAAVDAGNKVVCRHAIAPAATP